MKICNLPLEEMLAMIVADNDIARVTVVAYCPGIGADKDYSKKHPEQDIVRTLEVDASELGDIEALKNKCLAGAGERAGLTEADLVLGLTSKVRLGSAEPAHLFLLDFGCRACEGNLTAAVSFVEPLGAGFILESGRSYHYYLNGVFSTGQWRDLLGRVAAEDSLKSSRLLDHDWVGLQLSRGYSVLRLTANEHKPHLPRIVEAVGYQPVSVGPNQMRLFDSSVDAPTRRIERAGGYNH